MYLIHIGTVQEKTKQALLELISADIFAQLEELAAPPPPPKASSDVTQQQDESTTASTQKALLNQVCACVCMYVCMYVCMSGIV